MSESTAHTKTVDELVNERRAELSDAHVTDYDRIDDNGDKIREKKIQGPQGTTNTFEQNVTHMFQDAPSRTGDVSLLALEAELVDDGTELPNPHIPIREKTLQNALEQMREKGLTPAWEQ